MRFPTVSRTLGRTCTVTAQDKDPFNTSNVNLCDAYADWVPLHVHDRSGRSNSIATLPHTSQHKGQRCRTWINLEDAIVELQPVEPPVRLIQPAFGLWESGMTLRAAAENITIRQVMSCKGVSHG